MGINVFIETTLKSNEQNSKEKILNILTLSVPILMGIYLFFNPFSHTTAIKEICFYLSVFIVLILICFKKIHFSFKSPLTLPFAFLPPGHSSVFFLLYIRRTASMIFMRIYWNIWPSTDTNQPSTGCRVECYIAKWQPNTLDIVALRRTGAVFFLERYLLVHPYFPQNILVGLAPSW